jgi:hypothetical protein
MLSSSMRNGMRIILRLAAYLAVLLAFGCGGGSSGGTDQDQGGDTPGPNPATIGGCQVFPTGNPWNTDISAYPLHPNSGSYIAYILNGADKHLHPDFGGGGEYGIPYLVVDGDQARYEVIPEYADESDPDGGYGFHYPIPPDAPVENGSDAHVLVVDRDHCRLYELYAASFASGAWHCGSAAVFDLTSNALRPDYWTSADAAGLPIFPGLVRYDEVAAGEIAHAIRVTFSRTQKGFIHPATHYASSIADPNAPPMGLRLRLKASYDLSGITGDALVIARALKKYGFMVADNGSDFFFQGSRDTRWDDDDLNQLKTIPGSAFEAVYTGEIVH